MQTDVALSYTFHLQELNLDCSRSDGTVIVTLINLLKAHVLIHKAAKRSLFSLLTPLLCADTLEVV